MTTINVIQFTIEIIENEKSEFLLAFARRNVPIDLVLLEAEAHGLQWSVLDAGEGGLEPIYRLVWKQS